MSRQTVLKKNSKGKTKKSLRSKVSVVKKKSKATKKSVKKSVKKSKLVKSTHNTKPSGSSIASLLKNTQTEVFTLTGNKQVASDSFKFLSGFKNDPKSARDLASTVIKVAKLGDALALERTLEAVTKPKETELKVQVGGSLYWIAASTKEPDAVLFSAQSMLDFGESPVVAKKIASSLLFIAKQTKDPFAVVRSAMAISKLKDNPNAGMRMANILYSYVNHQRDTKDIGLKVAAVADQFVKTPMG